MKRVMIVGGPGADKSTLARLLGERTGLPVYHMDHIHWKAGWEERSEPEKSAMTREIHNKDIWIFEGGHSHTYEERFERADTFVWLDFPVMLRIWRVLRRSLTYYGRSRPDLPDGCPERFNRQTLEFLGYIWRTRYAGRSKLENLYKTGAPDKWLVHIQSMSAVEEFLSNLGKTSE